MAIYTIKQWEQDGTFKATPGQEITEEIYDHMLNCMPPKSLHRDQCECALTELRVVCHNGFLMGEPYTSDEKGNPLYLAFGSNVFNKGHFYYLGLMPELEFKNGCYYLFDCMGVLNNDNNLFPATDFKDDQDAINTAVNYEADLYKIVFVDGDIVDEVLLHETMF